MKLMTELGLDQQIVKAVTDLGFHQATPVQNEVIPLLLQDETPDIIAVAQTGTGKTAAFGLPLVQKTNTSDRQTQFLILSPTRELCLQIATDLTDYAKYTDPVRIVAVFGGASIDRQIKQIRRGAHIISATPGRLLDLIKRNVIDLSRIRTVVLDEADEMLNMGFRAELEAILRETPKQKNTLLFSATMPPEILSITRKYMTAPVEISVGKKNTGADNVEHMYFPVRESNKYPALKQLIGFFPEMYGIVFCRTRRQTQKVAESLQKDGFIADAIHGDLSQGQRDQVLGRFRKRQIRLLIATDVAARGLDVDDLTHIINYHLPETIETYIHRSGRTGRIGKAGISIVLTEKGDEKKIKKIEKQLQKKFNQSLLPTNEDLFKKQMVNVLEQIENAKSDDNRIEPFLPEIMDRLAGLDRDELIRKIVALEYARFAPNRPVEVETEPQPINEKPARKPKNVSNDNGDDMEFTRFFINIGTADQLKPTQLIGMINDFTGQPNIKVGAIDIMKNFSFFETDSTYADVIVQSFFRKKLRKRAVVLERAEPDIRGSKRRTNKDNSRKPFKRMRKKGVHTGV